VSAKASKSPTTPFQNVTKEFDAGIAIIAISLVPLLFYFVFRVIIRGESTTFHFLSKRMPRSNLSFKEVIGVGSICVYSVLCGMYWNSRPSSNKKVANSIGMVACGLTFLCIISATRNSVLYWTIKEPFERTVVYHRWLGRFVLGTSLWHAVYYLWVYYERDILKDRVLYKTKNLLGLVSVICLLIVYLSSINYIRRHYYQLFRWSHYCFIGYVVLGVLHAFQYKYHNFAWFMVVAGFFYLLDIALRYRFGTLISQQASIATLPGGVAKLRFNKLTNSKPGQWVSICFPDIDSRQWHPYSLTSTPHCDYSEVFIKGLGNHTNKIIQHGPAEVSPEMEAVLDIPSFDEKSTVRVKVDGPYGCLAHDYRKFQNVILVGGGIGITPLISILDELYASESTVYSVHFIWSIPTSSHYEWFAHNITTACNQSLRAGFPSLNVQVFLTQDSAEPMATIFSLGRPNMKVLLELIESPPGEEIIVYACGPASLVHSTWDECSKKSFSFHREVFEF